jgi:hypothetical protein
MMQNEQRNTEDCTLRHEKVAHCSTIRGELLLDEKLEGGYEESA